MVPSGATLERAVRTAGYVLLGTVGTAAAALALLYGSRPVQSLVYGAVYLQVGPSDATRTAILTQFVAVAAVAISVPTAVGLSPVLAAVDYATPDHAVLSAYVNYVDFRTALARRRGRERTPISKRAR